MIKKMWYSTAAVAMLPMLSLVALADEAGVPVVPAASPAPAAEVPTSDLLNMISDLVKNWHSLGTQMIFASVLMLLIASMKNSMVRAFTWDKLPAGLKPWLAPALSLVGALIMVHPFSWSAAVVALTTGMGAVALHELLDSAKAIPKLGSFWVTAIDFVGKLLKKPEAKKADDQPKA